MHVCMYECTIVYSMYVRTYIYVFVQRICMYCILYIYVCMYCMYVCKVPKYCLSPPSDREDQEMQRWIHEEVNVRCHLTRLGRSGLHYLTTYIHTVHTYIHYNLTYSNLF